jgi:hypothetical protein
VIYTKKVRLAFWVTFLVTSFGETKEVKKTFCYTDLPAGSQVTTEESQRATEMKNEEDLRTRITDF